MLNPLRESKNQDPNSSELLGMILNKYRRTSFQPRLDLQIENGRYRVEAVRNTKTLLTALRLRHAVFYREHHGISHGTLLDFDELDLLCEHYAIFDNSQNMMVGCFRLTSSLDSQVFYSSERFSLVDFIDLPGDKLELGRVCILPDYRTGAVIQALWRAVAEAMDLSNASWLFGCASVRTTKLAEVRALNQYFSQCYSEGSYQISVRSLGDGLSITPHVWRRFPNEMYAALDEKQIAGTEPNPLQIIPPLIKFYLRVGVTVHPEPALDKKLRCADFFSTLYWPSLHERYSDRFNETK